MVLHLRLICDELSIAPPEPKGNGGCFASVDISVRDPCYNGHMRYLLLAILLIGCGCGTIEDNPTKAVDACIDQGGIPILGDASGGYVLKKCQFQHP